MRDATELLRITWRDGELVVGPGPGRGAWLCADRPFECLETASRRGAFGRALHTAVLVSDVAALRARLKESLAGSGQVVRSGGHHESNERER